MSNTITPKFRASYANVFQAKKNDLNDKMEFSIVALFPKGADLSELKAAAAAAAKEKWGDKVPKNLRSPFRSEKQDGSTPDGMEDGGSFMNFKSNQKPGLIDARNQDIIDPVEFYSGCWARASVRAFAYDQKGNCGISFGLQNLQKLADGEPLGGSRVKASDEFKPVETTEAGASASSIFD